MKSMKRILAVLLVAILMMTLTVTAFAANETYTITINKDASDKAGHTYSAFQLFKGDLAERDGKKVLSNVSWGDNVTSATFITELKKIAAFQDLADDATAATVAKAISDANLADNSAEAKALAEAFNKALTGDPKGSIVVAADAASGQITGLPAGYYLVKDTVDVDGNGAETRYIMEVVSNVTVTEKASVPSVDKTVKEKNDTTGTETVQKAADYDIGDAVPFVFTGTLPSNFADYKTFKTYTFTDTLSAGLTAPGADDIKVTLNTENGTDLSTLFDVAVNGQTITVSLKEDVDLKTAEPGFTKDSKIVVSYSAVLNKSAKIGSEGNDNKVKLEFSNNPNADGGGDTGTTPEDKVVVFTYGIKALKVEPTSDEAIDETAYNALTDEEKTDYVKVGDKYQKTQPLSGAGFTLYKKVPAGTEGAVDGYVQVGGEITGVTAFEFKGTDAGEYKLVETTVPTGYNKADDILFTIMATYDTTGDDPKLTSLTVTPAASFTLTVTENKDAEDNVTSITTDGVATTRILNQKGATLPSTGGNGTTIFYVVGGLLALGAAIMLIAKKRIG